MADILIDGRSQSRELKNRAADSLLKSRWPVRTSLRVTPNQLKINPKVLHRSAIIFAYVFSDVLESGAESLGNLRRGLIALVRVE